MLPGLDPVREQMTGSPDQLDPDTLAAYLEKEIDHLERDGGFISIVLHLPLLDWLGERNLASILNKLSTTRSWVARCDRSRRPLLARPDDLRGKTATLDSTSWT